MSALQRVRTGFGALLYGCGLVAGIITFLVMCLVVANALSRFILNAPIAGTLEITESALPLLIFLSLALTQYEGGHIHVVLVTQHFGKRSQNVATFLAMVLGAIFFAWCAYAAFGFAMKSFAMNEQEWGSIRFPIWPVKFVILFGLALLAIQFALDALAVAFGLELADTDLEAVELDR
ncbi:TRAP transporter small permease subunit [Jiella mangrovi]|uniref:TRAP transporter small permease protein n=1 Tax=Jiella mangrovi TaxID=2821407 RepID=A0ABS4BL41_9HYPH|nr:TRAP transporter small permease [Jiella mangrovi]MBP0616880.1 TRAP transporter small permease [Jiella mangrovi]